MVCYFGGHVGLRGEYLFEEIKNGLLLMLEHGCVLALGNKCGATAIALK